MDPSAQVTPEGVRRSDPDALLLSATRRAAASRELRVSPRSNPGCIRATDLVGWIEETLPRDEQEDFEEHVAGCTACVAQVARFEAVRRAAEQEVCRAERQAPKRRVAPAATASGVLDRPATTALDRPSRSGEGTTSPPARAREDRATKALRGTSEGEET